MEIYVLYGRYYNPVRDIEVEHAIGFYSNSENAERIRAELEETGNGAYYYIAQESLL